MIRLAADENPNNDIIRGALRQQPDLDIVLEWAAQEERVLLTHDVSTITQYAYGRVRARKPMPGAFEIGRTVPIGRAIEDALLLAECSLDGEWEGQVRYFPLC